MLEFGRYRMLLWAVIVGLIVTSAGSLPWSLLVMLNVRYGSLVPWASVLMTLYLIVFLKYLGGWGPPRVTEATRHRLLRAGNMPRPIWRWALIAGGSANAALAAVFIVVGRLGWIHRPKAPWPVAPAWTIAAWLLTGAAVAGIAEESGFRGYMQKMLEERYQAPAAIAITSVIFGGIHLTHGFSVAIVFDAAWGAVYGALAFLTGSILPSVVMHASLDALGFFMVWRFAGVSPPPLIRLDGAAWSALAAGTALAAVAFWSFERLYHLRCSKP